MEIYPKYVEIIQVRYKINSSYSVNYYFRNKVELDCFMNENKQHEQSFEVQKTIALVHNGDYYPLSEKITFPKFCFSKQAEISNPYSSL